MSIALLFDENFGKPIVKALGNFLSFHNPAPKVEHLLDRIAMEGDNDAVWIPKCASEDWIVISADKGKHGLAKFPRICREYGVQHIILIGRLVHRPQFEKARAILVVWPELFIKVSEASRGARFKLKLRGTQPVLEHVE